MKWELFYGNTHLFVINVSVLFLAEPEVEAGERGGRRTDELPEVELRSLLPAQLHRAVPVPARHHLPPLLAPVPAPDCSDSGPGGEGLT